MDEQAQTRIANGLRRGQQEAWLELYDAFAPALWRMAGRLMGDDRGAIADMVQETMLAAARSAHGFDPARGSLRMWVWGIARNQIALHRRQHRVHQAALARARQWWAGKRPGTGPGSEPGNAIESDWLAGEEDAPLRVMESRELSVLVREALAALPDEYALLLMAKYFDDQPVETIARELHQSTEAVRSRLARARRAFAAAFRQRAASTLPDGLEARL